MDSNSASLRFIIVAALIGTLMVPLLLVNWVVSEREGFRNEAIGGISRSWGGAQRVTGPLLVIPFVRRVDDSETVERITLTPRELDLRIDSRHEMRQRAIYSTPVFHLEVTASGAFEPLDLDALQARLGAARLDQAEVVVGVSDSRGLRSAALTWDGGAIPLETGDGVDDHDRRVCPCVHEERPPRHHHGGYAGRTLRGAVRAATARVVRAPRRCGHPVVDARRGHERDTQPDAANGGHRPVNGLKGGH